MRSIGLNLEPYEKKGLLQFHAIHPAATGLEMHLVTIHKLVRQFKPSVVIIDPITNMISVGAVKDVKSMLMRLIDLLQAQGVTIMFTALNLETAVGEKTDENVSSLVDAWLLVKDVELNGERNRVIYIMKSRGMRHSKQVREFIISSKGLELVDIVMGPQGVLLGSARHEAQKLQRGKRQVSKEEKQRRDQAYFRQFGSK